MNPTLQRELESNSERARNEPEKAAKLRCAQSAWAKPIVNSAALIEPWMELIRRGAARLTLAALLSRLGVGSD